MKKFIKILAVFLPILMLSKHLIACTDNRKDINIWLEETDLGYLPNLKEPTVLSTFATKNPKAEKDVLSFYGNSYSGIIKVNPGFIRFYKGEIKINYSSKVAFGKPEDSYETSCEMSEEIDVCYVDLQIIDPLNKPLNEEDWNLFNFFGDAPLNQDEPKIIENKIIRYYFYIDELFSNHDLYSRCFWGSAVLFQLVVGN